MNPTMNGTWIGQTPFGVVVARIRAGEEGSTVDRPALDQFREPCQPTVHNGRPTVDGVTLGRVGVIPAELADSCGWYEASGRRLLLTQVPEAHFGEPMVLLAEGDQIVRGYPLNATRLLGEDGTIVDLISGGLRVTVGETVTELARSSRFGESHVTFEVRGVRLAGTVIVPNTPGPHPAAVVVHGAAGGGRDFCRLFAQPLLDANVATLIYDKPGHGQSEGDGDPSTFAQADAASAGMDVLASLPEIDASRIGLLGFSNGMWSVPMLAARRPDVAFVVGIGSPGVRMADAEIHRRTKVLREAGIGASTVAAAGVAWQCVFAIVGAGTATEDITSRLDEALRELAAAEDLRAYEIPDYVRANPMLSPIPPMVAVEELSAMVSGNPDPQVTHDPVTDYAKVRCPVFLQYGSEDTSVPVAASVERIAKALGLGGVRPTIRVYPGLEHMLNVVPDDITGLAPEAAMYGFHRFRFGAGVWQDLTDWLRHTMRTG